MSWRRYQWGRFPQRSTLTKFLQFCECGLQGIRDAQTAFRLSLFTSEKFSFENLLSNPCQVSWADFTLSGPVSISTEQRVISTGMVNEFGEKPERKNTAPFGPRILRMISQNLSIVP
jgi:hypothetical protein